jgi:hypothetical protein
MSRFLSLLASFLLLLLLSHASVDAETRVRLTPCPGTRLHPASFVELVGPSHALGSSALVYEICSHCSRTLAAFHAGRLQVHALDFAFPLCHSRKCLDERARRRTGDHLYCITSRFAFGLGVFPLASCVQVSLLDTNSNELGAFCTTD